MNALGQLQDMLRDTVQPTSEFRRLLAGGEHTLTKASADLERRFQGSDRCLASDDQISKSLQTFVERGRLRTLREAQRVCYGLPSPVSETCPSLFEDRQHFLKVLSRDDGVDQWLDKPRAFRRCFHGLTASYFCYDGGRPETSSVARHNWHDLRDYLHERVQMVHAAGRNPGWVDTLDRFMHVLTPSPFGDLPRHVLAGDDSLVQELLDGLAIDGDSWFRRDLLLAQIKHAATLGDAEFMELLERLVRSIEGSALIRDEGLAVILDRYMRCKMPVEHLFLRDVSVQWWGNPWLPSTELRWGRVSQDTRDTVARWLHKEFIEAFFSKLATGVDGDRRRAQFWLRYVGTFTDMKFGLGRKTRHSKDPDFKILIKKMKGLYGPIESSAVGGDAFIMTLGTLVVVEFSGYSNAMYGYDDSRQLPFVVEGDTVLRMEVDAPNSLKHSAPDSALRLRHQDDVRGYRKWESRFADELETRFGIVPLDGNDTPPKPSRSRVVRTFTTSAAAPESEEFYAFALKNHLRIEDLRSQGGNLWVRTNAVSKRVGIALRRMGFTYKPGKGWWKGS